MNPDQTCSTCKYLLVIDPGAKKCGLAIFIDGQLNLVKPINTKELGRYAHLGSKIHYTGSQYRRKLILVIENQYLDYKTLKYQKAIISLAHTAGNIAGQFEQQGFKVEWVTPWGRQGWIAGMLSNGGTIPNREQSKRLSLMVARDRWPEFEFKSDHVSDAALIGQFWLDTN